MLLPRSGVKVLVAPLSQDGPSTPFGPDMILTVWEVRLAGTLISNAKRANTWYMAMWCLKSGLVAGWALQRHVA